MCSEKKTKRPDGMLRSCFDNSPLPVWAATGVYPDGRKVDIWVDSKGKPVCVRGKEQPFWSALTFNTSAPAPQLGLLGR